ncbi:MAG TPA: non-homologous end-joining DNA ligase, partial [Acidobacteriota bacterium]|nr:non-homologous end-joining DNA ligase [Acidobacteriota bacterium]
MPEFIEDHGTSRLFILSPKAIKCPEAMIERSELSVEGRTLHLSNLGKMMYPEAAFTKSHMIDYYIRISSALLPHLKDRPITLKRYPDGVTGEYFYEKRAPSHTPDWVQTTLVERSSGKPDIMAVLINDLPTLIWSANLANLELHTPLSRAPHLHQPTMVVFDLDPGPPANVIDCARVALWLRDLLGTMKLPCFAKTSGSKGMQLYVPLNTPVTFEQTRAFSKAVGEALRREHRESIVVEMAKHLRTGKVFIDYSQNASRKTTVCVYSLRAAHSTPFVSTPVTWEELERAIKKNKPELLYFEAKEVLKRVEKNGDLFAPLLTLKHKLPSGFVEGPATRQGTDLSAYNAKRDFTRTREPDSGAGAVRKEEAGQLFVI